MQASFRDDQLALKQYQYRDHVITGKDGSTDARTLQVWFVQGHSVNETIALDGRELTAEEVAAEHARALERAKEAEQRPPAPVGVIEFDRQTYTFARVAADFTFGPPTVRVWQGRTTWVYPAMPNPEAPNRSRAEQLLLLAQGEVWVDAEDQHVCAIHLHMVSNFRYFLGVVANIHSAKMDLTLKREAPGVWLPQVSDFSLSGTMLVVKSLARSKRQEFSDYEMVDGRLSAVGGMTRKSAAAPKISISEE